MFASLTRRRAARKTRLALAALAVLGSAAAATPAMAHDRDDDRRDRHEYRRFEERVEIRRDYRPEVRVVAPCERVWVEPVYRTECVDVWVPDRFDVVTRVVGHGRRVITERVLIEPGHTVREERRVLVCAGHFEERPTLGVGVAFGLRLR